MVDYINKSMRTKKGFTLVEVVAVVIVLAIIAAVAIPRYADMRTNANQASVNSVAAGLGSASADNFTRRSSNSALGTAVANCTTIGTFTSPPNLLPSGFAITSLAIAAGASATCTVTGPTGLTATFVGMGVS